MRNPFVTALLSALLILGAKVRAAPATQPARQGAALLKTDIMGVFAHPDDETGAGAALAAYALGRGKIVANVYCTRGEGGGNNVGTQWGPALGVLREAELRDCLARLGVRYCYFLDQQDFFYTESVAATFQKWGKERTLERLVRLVRALRPDVMITMNPAPVPGQHGHHQAAGILATEAFDAAADPNRFPEQLAKEGLSVWQARKLYFGGGDPGHAAAVDVSEPLPDGSTPAQVAGQAMRHHRSQGFGGFGGVGPSSQRRRPQLFSLAKSVVPFEDAETDLFRGIPVKDEHLKRERPPISAPSDGPLSLEFVPRPAIAAYRQWAREQGIEHLLANVPADVPVIAGEPNEIQLEARNTGREALAGELELSIPAQWHAEPASLQYDVAPGQMRTLRFRLTPPESGPADAEMIATTRLGRATPKSVARAHRVPHLPVPRIASAPVIDAGDSGWSNIAWHEVPPTNLVEGHVRDAADSSARFRLAHDAKTLFVDVDVNDDVVVSNIAPNDIRGHWRSDSVEICIDPVGGAENTLRCFKVGIFPFDTTGVVRAARDADANQGPIEETAPGMKIASRRTPGGYRIQAAIPFSDVGIAPGARRLGFNLIIYDGDKADAAIGENINKSRIAWSPRPGVQGRPEDWGRIDLD